MIVKIRQPILHWIVVRTYRIVMRTMARMILLVHLIPCPEFFLKGRRREKQDLRPRTD